MPEKSGFRARWFGRKVARLPDRGVLLVATDLQGNYRDYLTLKSLYEREVRAGNEPVLLFCGDLVHGPGPALLDPDHWPDYLGTYYQDRSPELLLDFEQFAARERGLSLLGNHEHAHIGGPIVSKFHEDEAAVLDHSLGEHRDRIVEFMRSWPLVAVARCGAAFTHGAPRSTEQSLEDFEALVYDGYGRAPIQTMTEVDTLGALLWSRCAEPQHARAFLAATRVGPGCGGFVAFGHDVVREGFDKVGDEQICFSTSFGLHDQNKCYLRLDLAAQYSSVNDLEVGREILPLYPETGED